MIGPSLPTSSEDSFFVGINRIYDYAEKRSPVSRAQDLIITPYISDRDTVMYIVNYGNNSGWQIISADMRTPHVIAESNNGRFELDNDNPGVLAWISCMGTDLSYVRRASNTDLVFSDDEIMANMAFWQKQGDSPRALDPPINDGEEGRWYQTVVETTELVDSIPHLTVTQWGQHNPYNYYCPFKSNNYQVKAPAGCVAIAGAQMLYFLHYKYGVPVYAPSSATCIGDTTGWEMHQTDFTSTVWDEMDTDFIETFVGGPLFPVAESPLIASVGTLVGMDYGNDGSGATTSDLVDNVFSYYGISCEYSSFDEDDVMSSLLAGIPVVVRARSSWFPLFTSTHSFLIDGYRSTRTRYKILHYYMTNGGCFDPDYPEYYSYSYSPTQVVAVKMNWGLGSQWGNEPLNDGWYTLTGSWVINNEGEKAYDYYRHMIHNFSPITN